MCLLKRGRDTRKYLLSSSGAETEMLLTQRSITVMSAWIYSYLTLSFQDLTPLLSRHALWGIIKEHIYKSASTGFVAHHTFPVFYSPSSDVFMLPWRSVSSRILTYTPCHGVHWLKSPKPPWTHRPYNEQRVSWGGGVKTQGCPHNSPRWQLHERLTAGSSPPGP